MALKQPQTITDVNVLLSPLGKLGVVKEFKTPTIEKEIRMQENGGLTRPIDMGQFKELKIEFTLQEIPPEAAAWLGASKWISAPLLFKANIFQGGKSIPWVGTAKGLITKLDHGTLGPKKEVEAKYELALTFWAELIGGTQGVLFDTENLIAMVDGVDLLAEARTNLM